MISREKRLQLEGTWKLNDMLLNYLSSSTGENISKGRYGKILGSYKKFLFFPYLEGPSPGLVGAF